MFKYLKKFLQVSVIAVILASVTLPAAVHAQDCDANAIIRCGVSSQASLQQKYNQNQNGNVKQIYKIFGISSVGDLNGLVAGQVTRDNRVIVNGKVVATNAVTSGRQRISASDTPILGGAAYKRPPSVSFRSSSLPALVKMDGSRFLFAVILSCGNPVTGKPNNEKPKTPAFEVTKEVRVKGETAWHHDVTTQPGKQVEFRVVVRNTGQVNFNNVILRDTLPVGFTNVGSVTTTPSSTLSGNLFGPNGLSIGALAVGQQKEIIFGTVISGSVDACANPARNVFSAKPDNLTEKQADATVKVCKPEEKTPAFEVTKEVRVKGETAWHHDVTTQPGKQVEFRVVVRNTGQVDFTNVILRDTLPVGFTLSDIVVANGVQVLDPLFGQGLSIGALAVGQQKEIIFGTVISGSVDACANPARNVFSAKPDNLTEKQADATVKVCKPEEKTPAFEVTKEVRTPGETVWHDQATAKPGEKVEFRIVVRNTGQVDFTNVILRDTLPVGFTNAGSVTATPATTLSGDLFGPNGLSIGALAVGQQKEVNFETAINTATEACSQAARNVAVAKPDNLPEKQADATVKVCKEAQPVAVLAAVQTTPPVLPNTGPGDVLGIFGAVTVAGALVHRFVLSRRYN